MNDREIVRGHPARSGSFLESAENGPGISCPPRGGETVSHFCKPESAIWSGLENSLRFIDRVLVHPFLRIDAAKPEMSPVLIRVQLHRLLCLGQCSIVVASIV